MAKDNVVERLRAGGILNPRMVVAEAKRAGLRLDYACAMLQKETGGGSNVFGHDPTIFVGAGNVDEGEVSGLQAPARGQRQQADAGRRADPAHLLDAAGPGGRPGRLLEPADQHARRLQAPGRSHPPATARRIGARRYNGSGDAAVAYSKDLLARAAKWRGVLDGAVPVVVPAADGPLSSASRGPQVVRLTRRLSRLRSKAGTPYLDKPRKKVDATVETALKSFQNEHRLVADGVFGPLSQRKLNRALRLQDKRKKDKVATPTTPTPTPPAKRRRTLKTLVTAVHHADAETGEAWEALVAHAAKRRRVLARHAGRGRGARAGRRDGARRRASRR